MKKYILIGFIVALCLFITACFTNNENASVESEPPADTSQIAPNPLQTQSPPSVPQEEEVAEPEPEPALVPESGMSQQETAKPELENIPVLEPEVSQIYYDFFKNNFNIIEYDAIIQPWQHWGHNTQGELRLVKQISINQIKGFDYPVLILAEFALKEDGTPSSAYAPYTAYIIRNGKLISDLKREEFDAIFREYDGGDGMGSTARYESQFIEEVSTNGENLFFFDFSGDVRTDDSMDIVLDWLS